MSRTKGKSKASHGKRQDDAPQPAQLAAVRRLRCAALRQAFPRFRPLYELGYEIEVLADEPHPAAARAWDWHHAAPHSVLALESLAAAASDAGLYAPGL